MCQVLIVNVKNLFIIPSSFLRLELMISGKLQRQHIILRAGAVIKKRCERSGLLRLWYEKFLATDATFIQRAQCVRINMVKPRRPKNLWFKPAGKISFDLTQQKTERAFGNERFFVSRSLSAKKYSSWLASSE
jgi:hypothetical protein